jgi:predicted SnoaL-like aldol condensation-catalyzing enzyme
MSHTATLAPDTPGVSTVILETNRQLAVDFLARASAGQAREAFDQYVAPDFVHHNPYFPGDADSLAAAMDDNARQNPDKRLEILRTIAEDSFVAVHSRVRLRPEAQDMALVHIFRIVEGRIRELWDIGQEMPAESPNQLGMF